MAGEDHDAGNGPGFALVKIAIFHNLGAGSELLPLSAGPIRQGNPEDPRARRHLPRDPMARVLEGYIRVGKQGSGGAWIDAFRPTADPESQPQDPIQPDR